LNGLTKKRRQLLRARIRTNKKLSTYSLRMRKIKAS
jgi:hypothetical protein